MNTEHTCGCVAKREEAEAGNAVEKVEQAESRTTYMPRVDVVDSEKETLLVLDMPGVALENIDITVDKNILSVSGKQESASFPEHGLVYSEYGVGDYKRTFTLSRDIDRDGIAASLKDGVLTVKIPKMVQESKKITVAVS